MKQEKSEINNLIYHLKELEKQNPKSAKRGNNEPNVGAPQYVRQMLTSMKGEINTNTIIVGDFNTPLTPMDRQQVCFCMQQLLLNMMV